MTPQSKIKWIFAGSPDKGSLFNLYILCYTEEKPFGEGTS